jgi:hypothetical protein
VQARRKWRRTGSLLVPPNRVLGHPLVSDADASAGVIFVKAHDGSRVLKRKRMTLVGRQALHQVKGRAGGVDERLLVGLASVPLKDAFGQMHHCPVE